METGEFESPETTLSDGSTFRVTHFVEDSHTLHQTGWYHDRPVLHSRYTLTIHSTPSAHEHGVYQEFVDGLLAVDNVHWKDAQGRFHTSDFKLRYDGSTQEDDWVGGKQTRMVKYDASKDQTVTMTSSPDGSSIEHTVHVDRRTKRERRLRTQYTIPDAHGHRTDVHTIDYGKDTLATDRYVGSPAVRLEHIQTYHLGDPSPQTTVQPHRGAPYIGLLDNHGAAILQILRKEKLIKSPCKCYCKAY